MITFAKGENLTSFSFFLFFSCQVPGKHYVETSGVVTFAKGENLTSFSVEVRVSG